MALAPLGVGSFRALWTAVLVSNVGAWMQTVGAQWLLVRAPNAALLVSMVQVVDMLPDVAFGLVGGVLADTFDRRKLLIALQSFLAIVAIALTLLTIADEMPPALLLTFTFLLGLASVIALPAYQSLVNDIVPRSELRAAVTLGSVSINLARAVGPAIAGLLIARVGVAAVFAVNAAAFAFYAAVVTFWRPQLPERFGSREPFLAALRAGGRYVRYAPIVVRIFSRTAAFLIPGSVLWALLPLVATERLHQAAGGYGFLLAALGAGAILGSLVLPRIDARLTMNQIVAGATVVYAAALVAVVTVPSIWLATAVLIPAGVAWIAVLSNVNAGLQLFLPGWVRGRGLAVYQMVVFGSQGVGALLWGLTANRVGLVWTFALAAALLFLGAVSIARWPFAETSGMDRSPSQHWPEPRLAPAFEPQDEAVMVTVTYSIPEGDVAAFLDAMVGVRRERMRTGAERWGLFRDGEAPSRFIEVFLVASWEEHLRQHEERLTATDRAVEERARQLSDRPVETKHYLAADPD